MLKSQAMKINTGKGSVSLVVLLAIWSVSAIASLPGLAISPILGDLNKVFPKVTDLEIQMLTSLPSLLIIPFVLLSGKLSVGRDKLRILVVGLVIFLLSGIACLFIRNITALMDIRPDYANIERDGKLEQVDPDDVAVGTVITVQPGEKIPIDGEIVEGASTLNTAALTGESLPRDVMTGDEVISGCINMTGVLKVRTTKAFGESTVSKILELMENSSSHKSRSEAFISRFARVYTPAVCYSALALAILPPVINLLMGNAASWGVWIYRALTFLVISCPCALVISIPLSFFAGLGGAGHEGILIKGSNYLEALSKTKIVIFDKTGTLTQGVFEVTGVHHSPMEDRKLLEYAALAECASSHPISKSLQKACGVELDRSRVTDIEERSGRGVVATVDGHSVAAGNGKLMDELGVKWQDCHSVGTIVHMAVDGEYAGHIVISDVVKSDARDAIAALKRAGVQKTVMLTGDIKKVADHVAQAIEIILRMLAEARFRRGAVFLSAPARVAEYRVGDCFACRGIHQKGTHGIRAVVDAYDVCFLHGSLGVDRVFLRLVPAPFRRAGNAKVKLFYSFCAYFMLYYFFFFVLLCVLLFLFVFYMLPCVFLKYLLGQY